MRYDYDGEAWFMSPQYVFSGTNVSRVQRDYLLIKNANISGGHIFEGKVVPEYYITKDSNGHGIGLEIGNTETADARGIRFILDKLMINNSTGVENASFEFIAPKNAVWRDGIGYVFGSFRYARLSFVHGILVDYWWKDFEEPE